MILLNLVIDEINSGALDHAFNTPLSLQKRDYTSAMCSCSPSCSDSDCATRASNYLARGLSLSGRLAWLAFTVGFSERISYYANVMFGNYAEDGIDQIPLSPESQSRLFAVPTSIGFNYLLAWYLIVQFFVSIQNYWNVYSLSKKFKPLSSSKLFGDALKTVITLSFSAAASYLLFDLSKATGSSIVPSTGLMDTIEGVASLGSSTLATQVLSGLSKLLGISFVSAATFFGDTIQNYFGSQNIVDFFWVSSCCSKESESENSVRRILKKLEIIRKKLMEGAPIRNFNATEIPTSKELHTYLVAELNKITLPADTSGLIAQFREMWSAFQQLTRGEKIFHSVMMLIQIASTLGYAYEAATTANIDDEGWRYTIGLSAFLPFLSLYLGITKYISNFWINLTGEIKNQCRTTPNNPEYSVLTEIDQPAPKKSSAALIAKLAFVAISNYFAYFSSAPSLDLNKKTGWSFAVHFIYRVLTCFGTMVGNAYAVTELMKELDEIRTIRNFDAQRKNLVYTTDKLISFFKIQEGHLEVNLERIGSATPLMPLRSEPVAV